MSRSYATTRYSSSSGSTGTWYQDEIPSGTKNGINVTFTLAHSPVTELFLELNGQYLVSGIGYTLSGVTITMTVAPLSSDTLSANYLVGSSTTWYQDEIVATGTTGTSFALLHSPVMVVFLYKNGQYLVSGVGQDYTRVGTALTLSVSLLSTDILTANYS